MKPPGQLTDDELIVEIADCIKLEDKLNQDLSGANNLIGRHQSQIGQCQARRAQLDVELTNRKGGPGNQP